MDQPVYQDQPPAGQQQNIAVANQYQLFVSTIRSYIKYYSTTDAQTFLQVTMAKIDSTAPAATNNHCKSSPSQEDATAMPLNESLPVRHLDQESTERSNAVESYSSRPHLSFTTTAPLARNDDAGWRLQQEFVAMRRRNVERHCLAFAIDLMAEPEDGGGLFLTEDESEDDGGLLLTDAESNVSDGD